MWASFSIDLNIFRTKFLGVDVSVVFFLSSILGGRCGCLFLEMYGWKSVITFTQFTKCAMRTTTTNLKQTNGNFVLRIEFVVLTLSLFIFSPFLFHYLNRFYIPYDSVYLFKSHWTKPILNQFFNKRDVQLYLIIDAIAIYIYICIIDGGKKEWSHLMPPI